ncbi:MAG: RlmE family RNA methyltransferase [Gammaproteobacteria bacterium]|jgi:23S rRNA (uridine2552-2'-O)-methyltransferase
MSSPKNTKAWFKQHINDPFVKRAQKEGLRSRATYKLQELQDKYHLIKPGMVVVELGAAPGSWTVLLAKQIGKNGLLIAIDLLPMNPVENTIIFQGDIESDATLEDIHTALNNRKVDWVVSDCAPDLTGNSTMDALRALNLVQCVLDLADKLLPKGSGLLLKAFQGAGFPEFLQLLKQKYDKVRVIKPEASRAQSREVYILATGHKRTEP